MSIKFSLIVVVCKLAIFFTMLYNILLSPLWNQWLHVSDHSSSASYLPWLSDNRLRPLPDDAVNIRVVNGSEAYAESEGERTIFACPRTRTSPPFPICVYPTAMDKYISSALLTDGIWEPYITPLFADALRNYGNAVVIDVGANIGYYSLLSASLGHTVLAIEPSIVNVRHALRAIGLMTPAADGSSSTITVIQNAILDGRRKVTLTSNPDNQGGLWVVPLDERLGGQPIDNRSIGPIIDTILMDDLMTLLPPRRPVIIKVDIEGFECQAMSSAKRLFERFHVPYVFMEWGKMFRHRHRAGSACPAKAIKAMSERLSKLDYVAVEVRTGFVLDSRRSTTKWRIGDVYWRHKTAPQIQEPY